MEVEAIFLYLQRKIIMEENDVIVNMLKLHPGYNDFTNDKIWSLDYTYQGVDFNVRHHPGAPDNQISVEIQEGFDCNNITESQKEAIRVFKQIARWYFLDAFNNIDERNF